MPGVFWWYLPLLVGPALAGVLVWATSKPRWGALARRCGLLLVPSETAGVPIVDSFRALRAETAPNAAQLGEHGRYQLKKLQSA